MTFRKLWVIAFRDLGRNRRRSILTGAAVALGTALTIMMSGYMTGMVYETVQNGIRLQTGHVQIRNEAYVQEKLSLLPEDLLDNITSLEALANGLPEVEAATPVLWASGVLSTLHDTVGLQVYGIDPASPIHDHIREGLVSGEYLAADDRGGILIGKSLADDLGIGVGQRVSLMLGNADGAPEEGIFTIRGLFDTEVPSYDDNTVFMPLTKAQAFTRNDGYASAIVIILHDQEEAAQVADACDEISLPADIADPSPIPLGVLKFSQYQRQAELFVDFCAGPEGQSLVRQAGMAPAPGADETS